ncbi:4'-phosphopantetheinyl transferase superfamily protein, partial [Nguyenibacter vanlangensis]
MSLIGIGSDLCDIRRIERVIARHGERFLDRVFTQAERRRAERRNGQARLGAYAKRWA